MTLFDNFDSEHNLTYISRTQVSLLLHICLYTQKIDTLIHIHKYKND